MDAEVVRYLSQIPDADSDDAVYFNLAQAYYAAGDKGKAEETVLLALEAAPGYRPAQKLLLELEKPGAAADSKDKTDNKHDEK